MIRHLNKQIVTQTEIITLYKEETSEPLNPNCLTPGKVFSQSKYTNFTAKTYFSEIHCHLQLTTLPTKDETAKMTVRYLFRQFLEFPVAWS